MHVQLIRSAYDAMSGAPPPNLVSSPRPPAPTDDFVAKFSLMVPHGNARMEHIQQCMEMYKHELHLFAPTSVIRKPFVINGFVSVTMRNSELRKQIRSLCRAQKIKVPSKHVCDTYQHYVRFDSSTVVAYICLKTHNLNNTPGSVCVNIEIAVSIDSKHMMSNALDDLIKTLRRRRNKCVFFAQAADTPIATQFWKGRLTSTRRSSAMNGLLALVDPKHKVYEDTVDMALFML